ncbi:MAG: hypothetical protein HUJ68_10375 [Clostridia bacterium]|nr:hypothetical protein [Clostridia bacterium]
MVSFNLKNSLNKLITKNSLCNFEALSLMRDIIKVRLENANKEDIVSQLSEDLIFIEKAIEEIGRRRIN